MCSSECVESIFLPLSINNTCRSKICSPTNYVLGVVHQKMEEDHIHCLERGCWLAGLFHHCFIRQRTHFACFITSSYSCRLYELFHHQPLNYLNKLKQCRQYVDRMQYDDAVVSRHLSVLMRRNFKQT
jgi:hypothetical protein